jgi:alpha/beta superfamily hydrolase
LNAAPPSLKRLPIAGPAGALDAALTEPGAAAPRGLAVLAHPHPLHGGTMDNKVVQTLARAFVALGWRSLRFNFRGVGASAGAWDEGRGEVDDRLAAVTAVRAPGEALALGGFSFGAAMAARAAHRLPGGEAPARLMLVGTAVASFPAPAAPPDTLVIHGDADDVVPLADVLDWARPQALPVVVVPGVGHFFHGQLGLLKQVVIRWCS